MDTPSLQNAEERGNPGCSPLVVNRVINYKFSGPCVVNRPVIYSPLGDLCIAAYPEWGKVDKIVPSYSRILSILLLHCSLTSGRHFMRLYHSMEV